MHIAANKTIFSLPLPGSGMVIRVLHLLALTLGLFSNPGSLHPQTGWATISADYAVLHETPQPESPPPEMTFRHGLRLPQRTPAYVAGATDHRVEIFHEDLYGSYWVDKDDIEQDDVWNDRPYQFVSAGSSITDGLTIRGCHERGLTVRFLSPIDPHEPPLTTGQCKLAKNIFERELFTTTLIGSSKATRPDTPHFITIIGDAQSEFITPVQVEIPEPQRDALHDLLQQVITAQDTRVRMDVPYGFWYFKLHALHYAPENFYRIPVGNSSAWLIRYCDTQTGAYEGYCLLWQNSVHTSFDYYFPNPPLVFQIDQDVYVRMPGDYEESGASRTHIYRLDPHGTNWSTSSQMAAADAAANRVRK